MKGEAGLSNAKPSPVFVARVCSKEVNWGCLEILDFSRPFTLPVRWFPYSMMVPS